MSCRSHWRPAVSHSLISYLVPDTIVTLRYVTLPTVVHNTALQTTIQKAGRSHSIWYCHTASLVGFPTRQGTVAISRRYVPQIIIPNAAAYFPIHNNNTDSVTVKSGYASHFACSVSTAILLTVTQCSKRRSNTRPWRPCTAQPISGHNSSLLLNSSCLQ